MSRKFYSTDNTARKRKKRTAELEKDLENLVEDNDDAREYKIDVSTAQTVSIHNCLFPPDTSQINDFAFPQLDNIVSDLSSTENDVEDDGNNNDDDSDSDLGELLAASNVNYQQKIYPDSFLSIRDTCHIIIKLCRRLNLDKSKTKLLLDGIRSLLPNNNNMPRTVVGLMNVLGIDTERKVSYYCVECRSRLTTPKQTTCSVNCSLNNKYRSFSNVSELSINDVRNEIRTKIIQYANVILNYKNQSKLLLPCDVPNADIYTILSTNTSIRNDQQQITIMLHVDGAQVAKFGGKSLWPIQGTLCEIPPPLRDHQKATMVLGAWFSKRHPDRDLLWSNVVHQFQQIFQDKILVTINNNIFKFVVRVQLITFDLPALALSCNVIQYNGYYACPFCTIPGTSIDNRVYFPYSQNQYPPKTSDTYRRYSIQKSSNINTLGIKGSTPLNKVLVLPSQICIDYMHLSCSGHMRTLIGYWHKMLLPRVFSEASNYLTTIVLPHNFKYQFMPLIDYNIWKTKFFREFLIYISPVFCILFLPDKYAIHYLNYFLYIRVLYHYEKKVELNNIESLFDAYYKSFSTLYGQKSELLTVHLHLHLKEQVVNHGCLSMTSCFPHESYLGLALSMCHGKKYVLEQYSTWYNIERSLYENNSIEIDNIFITERFKEHHVNVQIIEQFKTKLFQCLIKQNIPVNDPLQIKYYSQYCRGFKTFQSQAYSRTEKAISYQISLLNSKCIHTKKKCYAEILFYFKIANINYAFVKKYSCVNLSITSGLTTVNVPQEILTRLDHYFGLFNVKNYSFKVVPVTNIINKVIKMGWNDANVFVFTDIVIDWDHN